MAPVSGLVKLKRLRVQTVILDLENVHRIQILDLLGLKIPDRNLLLNDVCGKYLNILECNAVYFNHIYSDQSDCLARNVFHFKRHLHKVR